MDCIKKIRDAVSQGEAASVASYIQEAVRYRYPPEAILEHGIIEGIQQVAERFKQAELCIPEVLMSARAFQIGVKTVSPLLPVSHRGNPPKIIIGTVSGDIHDIGKNIIVTALSAVGCYVTDLGVDVSAGRFVQAVREEEPDFVMISSLLTTTTGYMKDVIDLLEKQGLRGKVKVFVGGGPVTRKFAMRIGADYYTADAFELRDIVVKLMEGGTIQAK